MVGDRFSGTFDIHHAIAIRNDSLACSHVSCISYAWHGHAATLVPKRVQKGSLGFDNKVRVQCDSSSSEKCVRTILFLSGNDVEHALLKV